MSSELVLTSVVVVAVWSLLFLLNLLSYRQTPTGQPPPRPEWLREQFARKPLTGPLAYGVTALFVLPLVVTGVLLIGLADGPPARTLGAALVAWAVGQVALGIWRGRPHQRERYEEGLLAHSVEFWSRPDADERATRMRRGGPFSRSG